MRVDLYPSGTVDDLFIESVSIAIVRDGESRYALRVQGDSGLIIKFWTTRKDVILVEPWPDRPDWIFLELGESSELNSLRATDCDLHFEQLDRNVYFLGLYRDAVHWGITFRAHGYINTRVVQIPTDAA